MPGLIAANIPVNVDHTDREGERESPDEEVAEGGWETEEWVSMGVSGLARGSPVRRANIRLARTNSFCFSCLVHALTLSNDQSHSRMSQLDTDKYVGSAVGCASIQKLRYKCSRPRLSIVTVEGTLLFLCLGRSMDGGEVWNLMWPGRTRFNCQNNHSVSLEAMISNVTIT